MGGGERFFSTRIFQHTTWIIASPSLTMSTESSSPVWWMGCLTPARHLHQFHKTSPPVIYISRWARRGVASSCLPRGERGLAQWPRRGFAWRSVRLSRVHCFVTFGRSPESMVTVTVDGTCFQGPRSTPRRPPAEMSARPDLSGTVHWERIVQKTVLSSSVLKSVHFD